MKEEWHRDTMSFRQAKKSNVFTSKYNKVVFDSVLRQHTYIQMQKSLNASLNEALKHHEEV